VQLDDRGIALVARVVTGEPDEQLSG